MKKALIISLLLHLILLTTSKRYGLPFGTLGPKIGLIPFGGIEVISWPTPSVASSFEQVDTAGVSSEKTSQGSSGTGERNLGQNSELALTDVLGWGNRPPVYPREAIEWGWEGSLRLRVKVNAKGSTEKVTLLESSGYDLLDQEALRTAQLWRVPQAYAPTSFIIPIEFRLIN